MKSLTIHDIWPYLTDEARKKYEADGVQAPVIDTVSTQTAVKEPDMDAFLAYVKPERQASVRAQFEERDVRLKLMDAYSAIRLGCKSLGSQRSTNIPGDATPQEAAAYRLADRLMDAGTGFRFGQALDFATERLIEEIDAKLGPLAPYLKP